MATDRKKTRVLLTALLFCCLADVLSFDICGDNTANCAEKAAAGKCESNPGHVGRICAQSCQTCGPVPRGSPCTDMAAHCVSLAKDGHCVTNSSYMMWHCQSSCQTCHTCNRAMTLPAGRKYTPVCLGQHAVANASLLTFSVRTCADAVLVLSDLPSELLGASYFHLSLGGLVNTRSALDTSPNHTRVAELEHTPLTCNDFRQFYVSWEGGVLAVGEMAGSLELPYLSAPFMTYTTSQPIIVQSIFTSGYDDAGEWQFALPQEIPPCPKSLVTPPRLTFFPVCPDLWQGHGALTFTLTMCHSAHVLLSAGHSDIDPDAYDVEIGGNQNTLLAVRRGKGGELLTHVYRQDLSCDVAKTFYVSFRDNLLQVGPATLDQSTDSVTWLSPLLSYSLNSSFVAESVFVAGFDVEGHWQFVLTRNTSYSNVTQAVCEEPGPVPNSYRNVTSASVTYACYHGYSLTSGSLQRSCMSTGQFSGEPPVCTRSCGYPTVLSGETVVKVDDVNGYAMITCPGEAGLAETQYLFCNRSSGAWETARDDQPLDCSVPLQPLWTNQSTTSYRNRAHLATDGNNATCSVTLSGSTHYWMAGFGNTSHLYDVSGVFIQVSPDMESMGSELNVTVLGGAHDGTVLQPSSQGTIIAYNTGHRPWGHTLIISAHFDASQAGSLELCDVDILGTPHTDPCFPPRNSTGVEIRGVFDNSNGLPGFSAQHTVVYRCANGMAPLRGEDRATCDGYGVWTKPSLQCTYRRNYAALASHNTVRRKREVSTGSPVPDSARDGDDMTCGYFSWSSDLHLDLAQDLEVENVTLVLLKDACAGNITVNISVTSDGTRYKTYNDVIVETTDVFWKLLVTCSAQPVGNSIRMNISCSATHLYSDVYGLCEVRVFGRPYRQDRLECAKSPDFTDYKGVSNVSVSGRPCVRWDQLSYPYFYRIIGPHMDPFSSFSYATAYTAEACNVALCDLQCRVDEGGREYQGTQSTTADGVTCIRWDSRGLPSLSPEDFSDGSLDHNFCRNPGGFQSVPWCYTGISKGDVPTYGHCNITDCGELPPMIYVYEATTADESTTQVTSQSTFVNSNATSNITDVTDTASATTTNIITTAAFIEDITNATSFTGDVTTTTVKGTTWPSTGDTTTSSHTVVEGETAYSDVTTVQPEPNGETVNSDASTGVPAQAAHTTYAVTDSNDVSNSPYITQPNKTDMTGSGNGTGIQNCTCVCHKMPQPPDEARIWETVAAIQRELMVSKTKLSRNLRKKKSVEDGRWSAIFIGSTGIVGLVSFLFLFVFSDAVSVLAFLSKLCGGGNEYSPAQK